jgi:hypothetical protein
LCPTCYHVFFKYSMLTLSYSIALLLFLSFFQYIKDRNFSGELIVDSCQLSSGLSHDNPLKCVDLKCFNTCKSGCISAFH